VIGIPLAAARDTLRWSATAVRDTIASVVRERAYQRSLTTSVFQRFLTWLADLWRRILSPLKGSISARDLVIGLAVALVVIAIARMVYAARATSDEWDAVGEHRRRARTADPWTDVEQFAAAGRFTEAAHALYAALLARLAARGVIRMHPSKTAGDYARELRRREFADQARFQAFRVRYDRVVYGLRECTPEDYAALAREAEPLLSKAA